MSTGRNGRTKQPYRLAALPKERVENLHEIQLVSNYVESHVMSHARDSVLLKRKYGKLERTVGKNELSYGCEEYDAVTGTSGVDHSCGVCSKLQTYS